MWIVVLLTLASTSCNSALVKPTASTTVAPASPVSSEVSVATAVGDTSAPLPSLGSLTSAGLPPGTPSALSPSVPYSVINEQQKQQFTVQGNRVFSRSDLPATPISFDAPKLLTVLIETKAYFQKYQGQDPNIARPGLLGSQGVTVADTLKTIDFMIAVLQEDMAADRSPRLQDSKFIQANFNVIKWQAYNPQKLQQKQIRITKYAVFTHPGSHTKNPVYNTAIYSLAGAPPDFDYRKYTKQDVISGIYEAKGKEQGKVKPLAYLTRAGLEDALLEGTVLIKFTDGTQGYFNVDRNNDIPYIKGLDQKAQKRYWYFKPVEKIKGYGYQTAEKISIEPGVTFAGDVLNLGLGKVVVVADRSRANQSLRLGIIADTGGAFLPNLHQLDFLAGVFENPKQFQDYSQQLPEYVTAYFLVKK